MGTAPDPAAARVVHVVATASGWGGLERATVEIANEQRRRGRDLAVVASAEVCGRLDPGVAAHPFDFSGSRNSPLLLFRLCRLLRGLRPAILHLHANKAAVLGGRMRPFLPGVRTVATLQNTKRRVGAFRGHDAVIAVSRMAGASLGDIPHRVIWNAIRRPGPLPTPADLPARQPGRPALAAYGRFVEAKGFELLIDVLPEIPSAELWLAGDGKLAPAIREKVTSLDLVDRVWLPGFRRDAEAIAAAADLFVLPSVHEGFPFTLVEMLHHRVPVIATRVAGAEEILPAECLVDIGDRAGLLERLCWAVAEPERHREVMESVFAAAAERLEIGYCCDRIAEVYASVSGGG